MQALLHLLLAELRTQHIGQTIELRDALAEPLDRQRGKIMRRVIALEAVLYLLHDGPAPAIALSPHAIADDAAIEDKEPAGVHIEGSAIVVDDRVDIGQAIAFISRVLAVG